MRKINSEERCVYFSLFERNCDIKLGFYKIDECECRCATHATRIILILVTLFLWKLLKLKSNEMRARKSNLSLACRKLNIYFFSTEKEN